MTDLVFQATPLNGLFLVERPRKGDPRGFFSRFFDAGLFIEAGWTKPIAQMNHTCTDAAGTIRGMHFQRPPHAEYKYVSCLGGAVFDVAVDVRPESVTYGRWFAAELSAENGRSLLIPEGFAHGFQTLLPGSELIYLHSAVYAPGSEGGIDALDPALGIAWPLAVSVRSDRDVALPSLSQQAGS